MEANLTQYRAFDRNCRQLVRELVATGRYPNLENPNYKGLRDEDDLKTRVTILGRPIGLEETGERNLNLGGYETGIIVQADLNDLNDYTKGFVMEDGSLRRVPARKINFMTFCSTMGMSLSGKLGETSRQLSIGDYEGFAKNVLSSVDYALDEYKWQAKCYEGPSHSER